jgi:peptidoglycan/LPS O-acetylase OafA/YrhL
LQPSNRTRATLAVAGFWLLAMIAPIIGLIYFPAGSWTEAGGMFAFWVRRCPLFSLPEFLAGVSLAWLYLRFRPKPRSAFVMLVAPAIVLAFVLFYGEKLPALMLHNGLLIPLYAVLMLGLAQNNWLTRALSWTPLVLLGEASYALYLTHFLFGVWLGKAFHVDMGLMTLLWKLAIIIPVSVLLHLLVERPSRKALLRWWNREHPVPARR